MDLATRRGARGGGSSARLSDPTQTVRACHAGGGARSAATRRVEVRDVTFGATAVRVVASERSKRFELDLSLWGELDPTRCTWAAGAVGRMTLSLEKSAPKRWKGLLDKARSRQ